MRHILAGFALLAFLAFHDPVLAVNMIADDDTPVAEFEAASTLIDEKRFDEAIALLEKVVEEENDSPDLWSLLGFAYRNTGQADMAFAAYNKALLIDPEHIGANEYLGELYLQVGDLEKAKAQLRIIDDVCVSGCPSFDQLKAAIAAYEAGKR